MEKIKPCSVCGEANATIELFCDNYVITCGTCGYVVAYKNEQASVLAWNEKYNNIFREARTKAEKTKGKVFFEGMKGDKHGS